jgi:hypothetical protein
MLRGTTVIKAICTTFVLVAVASSSARAEDAENLIRQGVELRRQGDDVRAEGYFKIAYKQVPTPRAAGQLGLVELALNKSFEANIYLSEALESDDAWVQHIKATLEKSRERARSQLGEVDVAGAPDRATVKITKAGAKTELSLPADGRLWLTPGESTLVIEAAGFSATRAVSAKQGEVVKVDVEAERPHVAPAPVAPPPAAPAEAASSAPPPEAPTEGGVVVQPQGPAPGRPLRIAGIATAAGGAAIVVVGFVLRSVATSKYDTVIHSTPTQPYSNDDLDYKTYDRAGVALIIGGGVAAAAGVAMFVVGRHEAAASSGHDLAWSVGPAGFSFSGRF